MSVEPVAQSKHHPRDKLFRIILADKKEAEALLLAHLPEAITNELIWDTLTLVETSFVDEALRETESDVLYRIQHRSTKTEIFLYLLFEHQSVSDKWMRLRLYKYEGRIWDESFKWHLKQQWLPPIVPVVFYQGATPWNHSIDFVDLFPTAAQEWSFIPQFSHILIGQSSIHPDEIKGNLKARIMQLLMLAAYREPILETLRLAAQLTATLPPTGGTNYIYLFAHYVVATQERATAEEFIEIVQQTRQEIGDEMTTLAQEWLEEGKLEGKIEGKIEGKREGKLEGKAEMIENLLQMQMDWAFIEEATGVNEAKYAELRQQLAQLQQPNIQASDQLGTDEE